MQQHLSETSTLLHRNGSCDDTNNNGQFYHRTSLQNTPPLTHLSISDNYDTYDKRQQVDETDYGNKDHHDPLHQPDSSTGTGTINETIINLTKTCMGTGCLALPYACRNGGIILYSVGVALIAAWNVYCVQLLVECRTFMNNKANSIKKVRSSLLNGKDYESTILLPDVDNPKESGQSTVDHNPFSEGNTHTLGLVAYYAFGPKGLYGIDVCQIILLIGIVISYISAILSFFRDVVASVPTTTSNDDTALPVDKNDKIIDYIGAITTFIVLGSICAWVPNLSAFAKASAMGLGVLATSFMVIAAYGIYNRYIIHPDSLHSVISLDDNMIFDSTMTTATITKTRTFTDPNSNHLISINFWPSSVIGVTKWYGIVVFGYGSVPLTYNFQESMIEPNRIVGANWIAMSSVATLYILIGVGLYLLFPNIQADVLHELPTTGNIPFGLRVAMILIVFSTAPLIAVPCAEIIESKLFPKSNNLTPQQHSIPEYTTRMNKVIVRFGLIGLCTVIAVSLPGFVQVLSLVGCFCVATVSFCIPPLLHLQYSLLSFVQDESHTDKQQQIHNHNTKGTRCWWIFPVGPPCNSVIIRDTVLLLLGIVATLLSTFTTLHQINHPS